MVSHELHLFEEATAKMHLSVVAKWFKYSCWQSQRCSLPHKFPNNFMSFPRRTRRELSPGRFNRWRPSLPKAERGFLACTHTNKHTKQFLKNNSNLGIIRLGRNAFSDGLIIGTQFGANFFMVNFLDFQRVKTLERIVVKMCPKAPGWLRGWGGQNISEQCPDLWHGPTSAEGLPYFNVFFSFDHVRFVFIS